MVLSSVPPVDRTSPGILCDNKLRETTGHSDHSWRTRQDKSKTTGLTVLSWRLCCIHQGCSEARSCGHSILSIHIEAIRTAG